MSNIIETAAQAAGWKAKRKGRQVAMNRGGGRTGIELRISAEVAEQCFVRPFREDQAKEAARAKKEELKRKALDRALDEIGLRASKLAKIGELAANGDIEGALTLGQEFDADGGITDEEGAFLASLLTPETVEQLIQAADRREAQ